MPDVLNKDIVLKDLDGTQLWPLAHRDSGGYIIEETYLKNYIMKDGVKYPIDPNSLMFLNTSSSNPVIQTLGGDEVNIVDSVEYGLSDSPTTEPTTWYTEIPSTIPEGSYLWTKTSYSNGAVSYSISYQGKDGAPGQSTYIRYIESTADNIIKDRSTNTLTPPTVTFSFKIVAGNSDPAPYSGYYEIKSSQDGSAYTGSTSGTGTSTSAYRPDSADRFVRCYLYNNSTDRTLLDVKTVAILSDGLNGAAGITIDHIEEYYTLTQDTTPVPEPESSEWDWVVGGGSEGLPAMTQTDKYLWNYEKIYYSNNTTYVSDPVIIGAYGDNGRGISSITEYYQVTNSTQAPETGTSDWETTPQQVSENNKYLWNYEYISYTDGTHFESEPAIIGMFSKDGINGTDAYNAILSNENHTFPADDTGHAIAGSSTTGNVLGFEGTSQVATYVDVNNITGTPTGLSFQVSDNGTDHTMYTVTAANTLTTTNGTLSIPVILNHNESDEVTFYLSFSYSLAKAGTNGNDAEIYYIQTSANTITRNQDNVLSPNQITFSAFKQVGNNNPTAYQGKFYVESTTDFSTWTAFYYTTSSINEDHATISLTGLTSSVLAIRCRFYAAGTVIVPAPSSSEVPLDSQTILFVKDGADAYNIRFRDENISFAGDDTKALAGQSFTTKLDAFRGVNRIRATINPNNSTIQVPAGMSITWNNTLPQADPAPSVTLTISGNMTTQTGTINIPVRVNNRDFTIPLYFNLILKGKNGLDVTSYSVIPNHNYILISTDGTILPSDSVTFYAYKLIGSNRDAFTCNFRIYVMNNGSSTWTQVYPVSGQSAANESSHTYQISNIEITGIKAEIYSGNTKLDEESIPVLTRARDGTDGNDGEPGYSTAIIYLYQRAGDTPEKPIGDFTYTFSDGSLTPEEGADLNGWSLTIPGQDSAGDPLWVTVAMASSNYESDTIGEDEWQNPVIFSENGADGTPAYNNASVSLYIRSTAEPTVPSSTLTYNFTTGELTPASGYTGWSRYIPTGTDPVWVITANLSSLSSTDTITSQEWNGTGTAVRLARDGNDLSVSGVYYAESDQGTDPTLIPAVDWETSMPDVGPGNFLWTRIDYSDGSHSYSSTRQGVNGGDVTISSTSVKYSRSDSGTSTPSYWGDTPSTAKRKGQPGNYTYGPAEAGDYLWVRTIVNYSPAGSTTSYSISYIGTDGEDGNSAVIESVSKSSEGVTTIVMVDGEGNRSTITIDDGQDGENGRPGENGYVHIAWANSANGQTDFSTTVSTNKKYVGMYTDNTEADSQRYQDYSWSLIKGNDGLNQATITLYRRSSSNLTNSDRPSVAVKYTFSTGELNVNNTVTAGPIATNWYRNIPTGTDPVWITTASAISAEASTTITRTTGWSTPVKMVVNGVDGYNTATIYLYKRSTSNLNDSDKPSTPCYYRFSDKTLSLSNTSWSAITSLNNWSTTIPTGTNPIWVTAASVTSQSNISPAIIQSYWATPVKMAQSGTDGTSSCLVVLDNDSHIFPATDTHAINNSQAVINITGYEGTTQLTAKADIENLTNGSFAIREISGTIANKLTVSAPTISNNAIVLTVTALERLDSNNKAGVLNFLIDVKTSTGATLQYNKKFSWSLGLEGSAGDPAEIYYLTLSNNIIKKGYNSSGAATINPSNITVTVYKRVGNDSPTTSSDCYVEITKDNSVVSNTKTSSITYPTSGSLPTNISSLVFKLYDTNNSSTRKLLDTQSVGIIDGTISVKGVTEYYKTTTTNRAPDITDLTQWSATPSAADFSATNKYLWNTETVQYSNGTSGPASAAALIGTWGEAGSGISSIKEYYLKSNQSTGITTSTSGWVEVPGTGSTPNPVPVTSEDEPYLWNYEKITWVNPSSEKNTTPAIVGVHGRRGEHGFNTATVRLYKTSDNQPTGSAAKPSDTITYRFSDGNISGSLNSWLTSMPSTVPVWEITATALSDTAEDTIETPEWSTPRLISGKNGTNGTSQATLYVYKRAASVSTPSGGSYTFSSGSLTAPSGWSTAPVEKDSSNDWPCWVSSVTVIGTGTVSVTGWTTPVIYISKEMSVVSSRPLWYMKNSLLGIELSGNTTQEGSSGKNKLPIEAHVGLPYNPSAGTTISPTAKPTQWTNNGNGTFKMTLTSWEQASLITAPLTAGQYVARVTTVTAGMIIGIYVVNANGTSNRVSALKNGTTANEAFQVATTLTAGQYFAFYIAGGSGECVIKEPMVEAGSTATAYEPHISPTNPQIIHNVSGDNTVTVCGKNLIDGMVYESDNYYIKTVTLSPNTYTFSYSGQQSVGIYVRKGTNPSGESVSYIYGSNKISFTITEYGVYTIRCGRFNSGQIWDTPPTNAQLEVGSTATTYEPYTRQSYPIYLPVENLFDRTQVPSSLVSWTYYVPNFGDNAKAYPIYIGKGKTATFKSNIPTLTSGNGFYAINALSEGSTNTLNDTHERTISANNSGYVYVGMITNRQYYQEVIDGTYYIHVTVGNVSNVQDYSIELNKIGTYQDYIYKNGGKWYVHKEFSKVDLGTLTWTYNTTGRVFYVTLNPAPPIHTNTTKADAYCSKYPITTWSGKTDKSAQIFYSFVNGINIEDETYTDARTFKSSISGTELVYRIATPTNTEITDTTLIAQLNSLETAQSASSKVTNILQENSDLPFNYTYSEANTEWPPKPTEEVTTTSTAPDIWSLMPATYIEGYRYYNSYQTKLSDGSLFWSEVTPGTAIQNADGIYAGISNQAQVFNVNKNGVFDTDTPSEGITVWGIIGTEEVVPTNISVNYNGTNILNNATTASIYARLSSNVVTITFKAGFPGGTNPISSGTINIEFVVGTKSFKFPYNFTLVKRNKQITEIRPLYYLKQSNTVAPSSPAQQSGWPNISSWTSTSPNIWSTKKPNYIKPTITFDSQGNPVVGNDVYYYWTCQVTKYNDGSTDISTIILDSELNSVELTVSTNSAKITENEKDILARVTQTDFDLTINGDGVTTKGIKGDIGQLQLTAEEYTSKVSSFATKTDLNGYVTTNTYNSYINQTAKEITRGLQKQITDNNGLIKNIEGGVKVELVNNKTQVTIGNSESEVRGVFTNTALEFKNRSDQRLAWLDSTDGLGATSLSLGSASTVSNRWRIVVSDDGNHLTFTRHN